MDTDRKPLPIIGFKGAKTLGLLSCVDSVAQDMMSLSSTIFRDYANLFQGLGCIPGNFRLKLKQDAVPVVRPCTRIPFGLRLRLKEELKNMVHHNIIAPVTHSTEWSMG